MARQTIAQLKDQIVDLEDTVYQLKEYILAHQGGKKALRDLGVDDGRDGIFQITLVIDADHITEDDEEIVMDVIDEKLHNAPFYVVDPAANREIVDSVLRVVEIKFVEEN